MKTDVVWYAVKRYAKRIGPDHLAPHDLRRTCARLCHEAGGELEQIQFLLGHASVQTTERYIGCKQNLKEAVNDRFQFSLGRYAKLKAKERPTIIRFIWMQKARRGSSKYDWTSLVAFMKLWMLPLPWIFSPVPNACRVFLPGKWHNNAAWEFCRDIPLSRINLELCQAITTPQASGLKLGQLQGRCSEVGIA